MKKLLFGLLAGISAGLLFAPKSGKKLRAELKTSDAKFTDFGNAFLAAAKDAGDEVQELIDSDDVKKMIHSGKKGVDDFVNLIEKKGGNLSRKARFELDNLLDDAMQAAQEAKKNVQKKTNELKKAATKKMNTAKKTAKKKATTVKKDITKKATALKKTAKKKVATAKKSAEKTVKKITKK